MRAHRGHQPSVPGKRVDRVLVQQKVLVTTAWADVLHGADEVGLVYGARFVSDSVVERLGWLADVLAEWVLRIGRRWDI